MKITSFNYYYYRRYGHVPPPQAALDAAGLPGLTFASMVL